MNEIYEFLKEINIAQIIAMAAMLWFFYARLDRKIDRLGIKIDAVDQRLSARIDALDQRLSGKIDDIDRRLCRIEGSLATQGHCLFQQREQDKKAE